MSKYQFITTQSASNVTSMQITNCFSAQYSIYEIHLNQIEFSGGGDLNIRFMTSGGPDSGANYNAGVSLQRSYGAFADNVRDGATSIGSIGYDNLLKGGATTIRVFEPFDSSKWTYCMFQNTGNSTSGPPVRKGIGALEVDSSIVGIEFIGDSSGLNVKASIYGVQE